jgi:pimeloyl-ACP methyl ester carboxylesterase
MAPAGTEVSLAGLRLGWQGRGSFGGARGPRLAPGEKAQAEGESHQAEARYGHHGHVEKEGIHAEIQGNPDPPVAEELGRMYAGSAMQPLFEHRLTLGGYDTRALELEGDGPPLVLLHGYSDSADTWRLVLHHLGRLGRRALAVDMPGFGTADPLRPGKPILPQLDAFARAAVEEIAPGGGAVVVGNSLGGCTALRLAEQEDLGLAGVVPVAPAGLDMARWFVLLERDPIVRWLLAAPVPLPGGVVKRAVSELYRRVAFHKPAGVDPKVFATFAGHVATREVAARTLDTGHRLLPELREPFRLDRIACPVLLVWGRHDLMVFQTGADRVLDAVPDSDLEVIEDCGHCPQIEAPERLVDLLVDFPERVARAA